MASLIGLSGDRSAIIVMVDRATADPHALGWILPWTPARSDPADGVHLLPLSWPALVQALHALPDAVLSDELADWWRLQDQLRGPLDWPLQYTPPAPLVPYPWQAAGAARFALTGSLLPSDDPGTGKTITAILGVCERQLLFGDALPVVVQAPASTIPAWVTAWRKWAPHLEVCDWRGSRRERLLGEHDVYVTSYETGCVGRWRGDKPHRRWEWGKTTTALRDLLRDAPGGTTIADEHHLLKTPTVRRTLGQHRLARAARHHMAMSGTPIANHPGDFWGGLAAVWPDGYPAHSRYVERYCQTIPAEYGEPKIVGLDARMRPELDESLRGVHRRVSKAEALPFLPPKVYTEREVTLPAAWRKVYDDLEGKMLAQLPDQIEPLAVMGVLAQLTFLSRLASAPGRVEVEERWDDRLGLDVPHYSLHMEPTSWKVTELLAVLDERDGRPTVVFTVARELAELAADAVRGHGLRVGMIVGGQPAKERQEQIDRFQAGDLDVMIATISAGGVGVTLTAADCVVFLQRSWSVIESIQAEDRCHRIGSEQHQSVQIIDIVAADTLEADIRHALRDKAASLADLLKDPTIAADLLGGRRPTRKAA